MSTMTRAAAVAHPGRSVGGGLAALLRRWWLARMERRLERLAMCRLQAMSDRELKDIGIARTEIDFMVRAGRGHASRFPGWF